MALGTPLAQLMVMLKAEARLTQSASAGLNSDLTLRTILARVQSDLWLDHTWDHLKVYRNVLTQAGGRYYAVPADLDQLRIFNVAQKWNQLWRPVGYGVSEAEYNLFDPEQNRRTDPVLKWQLTEGNLIELWPLPATDGISVRFHGQKTLGPLIQDADTAGLDDMLICLIAAAEMLASSGAKDAKAKVEAATGRYRRLRGADNRGQFNMRGPGGHKSNAQNGDDPFRIRVTYARAR
jgi:hypothetical protein